MSLQSGQYRGNCATTLAIDGRSTGWPGDRGLARADNLLAGDIKSFAAHRIIPPCRTVMHHGMAAIRHRQPQSGFRRNEAPAPIRPASDMLLPPGPGAARPRRHPTRLRRVQPIRHPPSPSGAAFRCTGAGGTSAAPLIMISAVAGSTSPMPIASRCIAAPISPSMPAIASGSTSRSASISRKGVPAACPAIAHSVPRSPRRSASSR